MVFVTAQFLLCLLPHVRSVKVVIDGTIDLGPNWNFEYRLEPISSAEPRKSKSDVPDTLLNSEEVRTKLFAKEIEAVTTEILHDANENEKRDRAILVEKSDNSVSKNSAEGVVGATRLYKTDVENQGIFRKPRKIKDDIKVVKFVERIKNETLKMFDNLREKYDDKAVVQKISDLKDRYANEFGKFNNETKHHSIRTTLGDKKVILNTIDHSNKLLSRLFNRFKVDLVNSDLSNSHGPSETFKQHINSLKNDAYENACRIFSICRAGNEFSDHINDLISSVLKRDDAKVQSAVEAVVKSLKNTDFSKIMDFETQQAFRNVLANIEELNPFDLRVLLLACKIIIEGRHQPFLNRDPNDPSVQVLAAMYHVMEGFNKKIIISTKDWNIIKKDYDRWLVNDEGNVTDITNRLMDRVINDIETLDDKTANDFKAKLRICLLANTLKSHLNSFISFQTLLI